MALNILINQIFKQHKWFLISLFIFSFFVRAAVFYFYLEKDKNYWQVDSNTYHKIAESVAQGDGFYTNNKPNFYRLPGYPFFLSIYYKCFSADTKNVLWLQILLASIIPILIFFLSFVLISGNIWIAKCASFYSSIHLGLILYSGFFMSETLFIFLFFIFAILFFQNLHTYLNLFLAGIFLGLASLVRPVGHYLVFFAILNLFFWGNKFKYKIKKSVIFFVGWLVVVGPWLLRNYLLLGQVFFHTLPGGHFLHFSASRNVMYEQNCNYEKANDFLRDKVTKIVDYKERVLKRKLNEIEICNIRQELAIEYFKKYPILTLKNWCTDILRTSLSLYSSELLRIESDNKPFDYFSSKRTIFSLFKRYLIPETRSMFLRVLIFFEIVSFAIILIGFLLGSIISVFLFFRKKNFFVSCLYFKVLPFIFLFLIIGLAGGYSRMRLPAEPFIIILSFVFYYYILDVKKLKREFSDL